MRYMQALKNKLKSRRGASITFALLLFLVCAVVGSAVLTAGTVAAGRMSKIAEMDQRYYSVNSAARLLIELVEDSKSIIIEHRDTTGSSTVSTYYTDETGASITLNDFTSVADEAAYYIVCTPTDIQREVTPYKFQVTVTQAEGSTLDLSSLNVQVEETIKRGTEPTSATLYLTVKSNTDKAYALQLSFSMDMKEMLEKKDNEDIISRTIRWHFLNAKVIGSGR